MLSQNACRHANACRFCWMCRHLCPVGLKTGKEVNTPRAKGLLLSMIERGNAQFDADTAQIMYECMLCGACTNDCATGYEPPLFIREARTQAVVDGIAPKAVMDVIEAVEKTGTIYGVKKPSYGTHSKADVLLYLGEVAAVAEPAMAKAYRNLLHKAGVSFMVLDNEPASGTMLGDLEGFVADVQAQAKNCADAINASGAKTVVVLDSYDAVTFSVRYPEWGCALKAQVVTATAYLAALVKTGKLKPKKLGGVVCYHDDSRLARTLHEFEPAREVLAAMGCTVKEMFQNRKLSKSCGTSVAKAYMPEITKLTAEGRWEDFARVPDAETLVVANPEAKEVLAMAVPEGKKLADLYTLLDSACQ